MSRTSQRELRTLVGGRGQAGEGRLYRSFRPAILLALHRANAPLTLPEIEDAVSRYLTQPRTGTVGQDLALLLAEGLVGEQSVGPHSFVVTQNGKELVEQVLANGA